MSEGEPAHLGWVTAHPARVRRRVRAARVLYRPKQQVPLFTCNRRGGGLERILSSLAREWLRMTNGLLIVEDPEPAPGSPKKLMGVNGAERRTEILVR